jgi:hypothetical protein
MSHITIIINSNPSSAGRAALAPETGSCTTSVTYTPTDDLNASQIGNRVAEIVKKMAKIDQED